MNKDTTPFDEKEMTSPAPSSGENLSSKKDSPEENDSSKNTDKKEEKEVVQKPARVSKRKKTETFFTTVEENNTSPVLHSVENGLEHFLLKLHSGDMPENTPDLSQGIDFQSPYETLEKINNDISALRETAFVTLACNAGLKEEDRTIQIEKIYTVLTEEVSARSFLAEKQAQHLKDYYSRLGGLILGTQEATRVLTHDLNNEQKYTHLMDSGLFYAPEIWAKFIDEEKVETSADVSLSPMQILEQIQSSMTLLVHSSEKQIAITEQNTSSENTSITSDDFERLNQKLDDVLNEKENLSHIIQEQVENISALEVQVEKLLAVLNRPVADMPPVPSAVPSVASPSPVVPPSSAIPDDFATEPPVETLPDEFEDDISQPAPSPIDASDPVSNLMRQVLSQNSASVSPSARQPVPVASDDEAI